MALTRPKYSQIYDTDWKQSVEAGTIGSDIGNLIVGNTQPSILDGFSLSIGNRILVKDQTDGTQNGLYRVANVGSGSNGWWVRTLDANQSGFVTSGLTVVVDAGTVNGGREFRLITQDPITLGSTSLTFISQTGNPGGANTQVQFYDSISGIPQLSGTPGFTYNKTSNAVVMSGNLSVSNINATANISTAQLNAGQINTTGNILSTGAILNALTVNGGITSTGFFNTTANISTAQLNAGQINTTGNVLATNAVINALTVNGVTTQSGNLNVTNGNLNVIGTTWVTGNILPTANVTYNLGSPTNKFKSAYFSGNTVYIGSESMGVDTNGTWLFTSNGATVSLGINATFNPASVNASGNIIAGAIYSGIIGNVNTALTGTLQTAAQPNITSVGTLTSLNVTGNVLASSLTGTLTTASQTAITQIGTLVGLNVSGNVTTNILNAPTIYANNYVSAGAVYSPIIGNTGTTLVGTLSTAAQPNITSVGILTGLNVSGNISSAVNNTNLLNSSGNVIANTVSAYALGGIITTASQTNITQVGTLTSLNVTGNVLATNLTGTLTTANQSAITQVGTLAGLNVSGNVTTNVLNAPLVYANTYVSAGAVYAPTIGNTGAVLTGTLSTAAQTNITSVGSLNTLNVLGNTTIGGNLFVVGTITTIGNVNNITITGNAGQFFGNVNGFGALYAGIGSGYTFEAQTTLQISSNYNGYAQLNMQNINHGPLASSDYIVTADNGTAGDTYVDLGMASSTYNYPGFTLIRPNDGYLIAYGNTTTGGGNLLLASSLNDIVFSVGGQGNISASSEFGRIQASSNAFIIKSTTTSTNTTSGALQVAGGVGIQGTVVAAQLNSTGNVLGAIGNFGSVNATGNVLATNFVGSGSLLTVLPGYAYSNVNVTAYTQTMGYTNYSNVNVTAYLAGSITTGAITATGLINTTGNVSAATLIAGQINTTGNVLAVNFVGGGVNVSGNVSAATIIAGQINTTGNVLGVVGNFGSVNTTGNVSAATVIAGQINTTGNVLGLVGAFGSINSTGLINTTGNVSAATIIAGQINTTGNVLAVNFVGSGGLLTALPGYAYSNVNVTAYTQTMGYTNYSNVNVAAYLAGSISTGAITASGAINTTANISAATVVAGQINTTGNVLSTGAVHNTLTVNGTASTNVASVASTILAGAVGVTGNIIANASVIYGNTSGGYGVRQFFNPITNSLDTVFG